MEAVRIMSEDPQAKFCALCIPFTSCLEESVFDKAYQRNFENSIFIANKRKLCLAHVPLTYMGAGVSLH